MSTESVPLPADARALRGLQAWRQGAVGFHDGAWIVAGSRGEIYRVTLDPEGCECWDHQRRGVVCKHLYAATVERAKTLPCAGCWERFRRRELVEAQEGDGLTHDEGQRFCRPCADRLGVQR